jgi:UTP--glucose-1-phosphate uridylyltransferase
MIGKCLFPVAGYGTRFLPATKSMPKEMLPIVNKPLVQYGVEEAIEAGMSNCALVTGRGKRAIADHFDISYELEHQIAGSSKEEYLSGIRDVIDRGVFTMVRQREMLGLGHAILTGEPLIGDQPFGVVLSDDLCLNKGGPGVLAQMAALYVEHQCSIVAVQEVPREEVDKYGVVAGATEGGGLTRVSEMVEKPSPEEAPVQSRSDWPLHPDAGYFRHYSRHPSGKKWRGAAYRRAADAGSGRPGAGLSVQGAAF